MPSFAPGYIISRRRVPRPGPAPVQTEPTFPLPLKAASVEAKVSDFCASITVRQKFVNTEDSPIEAIYQFPLEDKATVSDFTAIVDGNKIKGTIQEKEEAKNTYDDAISSGHGAYLMEQDEEVPNVFTVNVGNLPPGKEVDIAITYVIELTFEEGQLRFCMPSNENPSYKALGATGALPQIKLRIDFHMTSAIRSLSSPSHPITFEFGEEPTQATVTLASDSPQAQAAKDFIVLTKLAKPHEPCGRVEVNEQGTKTVMVSLYPKLDLADDEDIYTEMIFIVDRSGSMSRSRINQVKDTLQIFLRSLGEGTMFNIIGFGTSTQHLFPRGSVEYNDKNLDVATKHVQTMLADLGGTNILKPLQQVLQSPTKEGYPRQLFILTDGEVGNTQECINFVRQHAQTTRVFTFGVGNDASQDLVQGLAKAGEGFYEFVRPGDAMEDKVLRQLRRAMQPALTDIEVAWKGAAHVQPAPFRLPPLFCGGRLVVYGIVDDKSSAAGEVEITVRAKTVLRPFEAVVKVDTTKAEPGTLFHKLAARTLLKDLEEGRSYMHDASGKVKSGAGDVKAEAVRISLQSGILCKHTAFVAVEERDEATEGTMQVRKIPITFEKPAVAARPHAPVRSLSGPATGRGGAVVRSRSGAGPVAKPVCKKKKASAPVCNKKKASAPAPSGTKFAMAVSSFGAKSKCLAMPATNQSELCLSSSISENYSNDLDELDEDEEEVVVVKKEKKDKDRKKKKEKETEKKESQPSLARRSLAAPSSSVSSSSAAAAPLSSASPQSAVAPPPTQMREIIMKQKANGSWDWSDAVSLVRQSADQLRAGIPAAKLSKVDKEVESLWATAVVAAYLSKNFAEQKTNWDLVVQKAIKFIARQKKNMPLKNADEELDWFQLALAFLA